MCTHSICAIQQTPTVNPPPAVGTELDDFLQGWPDVPPLVVMEAATQHDVSWRDASKSTDRQVFNAAVQAGPPTLSGPGLLASPELVRWAAHHAVTQADLLSDHVVQSLLEESLDLMAPGAPRELLNTVVAVACRAQQTMARLLLRRLCGYDGEPEVRRADFLAAFVLLEEAAERSVGQYD